jgi:hypothetical protein
MAWCFVIPSWCCGGTSQRTYRRVFLLYLKNPFPIDLRNNPVDLFFGFFVSVEIIDTLRFLRGIALDNEFEAIAQCSALRSGNRRRLCHALSHEESCRTEAPCAMPSRRFPTPVVHKRNALSACGVTDGQCRTTGQDAKLVRQTRPCRIAQRQCDLLQ